jgi:hypothetical protein
MPLATFAKNVKGEMLYLECNEVKDDEWRCLHNRKKLLDYFSPVLAPASR